MKKLFSLSILLIINILAHTQTPKINRQAVVKRHTVVLNKADTLASLSVGNGKFCFTADITGLQTFPDEYAKGIPLGTQSEWGWHSFPNTPEGINEGYKIEDALKDYDSHGRKVPYAVQLSNPEHNKLAVNYLRQNPHRLQLGNLGFDLSKKDGSPVKLEDIKDIHQTLDMWTGELKSHFTIENEAIDVSTFCHQEQDIISVKVKSKLLKSGQIKIRLRFPYPTDKFLDEGNNWGDEDKHYSAITLNIKNGAIIQSVIDTTFNHVYLNWEKSKSSILKTKEHYYVLTPSVSNDIFELNATFVPSYNIGNIPNFSSFSFNKTENNNHKKWQAFWQSGGAIDFSQTKNPRAFELERRVILSQYLTKIQCTGNMPPQETGLTYNSWFGKPHLEMHWWHGVHFAQWGRAALMEKSLDWYEKTQNEARIIAKRQGFKGVRWQKMTDPDGREAPSSVGAFLIWQQPHFIYFAEQAYQAHANKKTLEKYKDLVFDAGLNFSQSNFNGYSGPLTYVNSATVQSSSNADLSNTEFWDVNFQHLLYYDKVFAEKHKIGITGLYEITKNHSQGSAFNVKGVPADYILTSNFALASGQPTATTNGGNFFSETGLLSYMGRFNYGYDNRYLLTLTMRRDGSSTLSAGNQYFNYPSVGLGWNITEEGFMKTQTLFSNLKLRGGWGISGNRNVGAYATLGALSAGYYNFGTTTSGQQLAYTVTSLPATNLGWQSTSQYDVGLEIGLFKNRITGSFDIYNQQTSNILLSVNLPQSNGAGSTLKNLGKTEGKGFESTMSFEIFKSPKGFNWSTDVTYFYNKEKIVQLTTPEELSNKGNGWFVGQPLSVIYDYKKIGIWQQTDVDNGLLAKQTSPVQYAGQIRVEDVNADGKITADDRQVIGNFQPKWEGGLTNRFSYGNFDASIVMYARMGMKVAVPYLTGNASGGTGFDFFNQSRSNQMKVNYWTKDNPTNEFPAPDAGGAVAYYGSTLGYYDGSFIKCRSINLGYNLSNNLFKKAGISSARIYVNMTNPFIFYSPLVKAGLAIDPKGNGYANAVVPTGASDVPTGSRQIAVNMNNPPVRQMTVGLNLKF